jgi:hypothetical protein
VEHHERTERMEHDADRMEHDTDKLGDHIDETRREWESKQQDPSVPGARPDPAEEDEDESVPGTIAGDDQDGE